MGARIREDYRNITGPEKSAILLMSLGEDHAAKLFSHLDDEEIKEISQVMASLGNVSSNIVERLFVEFCRAGLLHRLTGRHDGQHPAHADQDPRRRPGQRHHGGDPVGPADHVKLANVNEQVLANYLKN